MEQSRLDQRRADMMEALYQASGRTNNLFTGLWQEFCGDLGTNFRDTDYKELHAAIIEAIGSTDSCLAEKHATAAIAVCRQFLLGRWA